MDRQNMPADTWNVNGAEPLETVPAWTEIAADESAPPCADKTTSDPCGVDERGGNRKPTQADELVALARLTAVMFIGRDGAAYARIKVQQHKEVWAVRSPGFKLWLQGQYYAATSRASNSDAISKAQATLEAIAHCGGKIEPIYVRRGAAGGKMYLDLCDKKWRAIEIDADGWRIVDNPPVNFIRTRSMLPLPVPALGGSIHELFPFLNVQASGDQQLVVGWLLGALRPTGPYPVFGAIGEPGTAKSSTARLLRALIDPNVADIRSTPTEARDVFVAACNSGSLVYDNLSSIPTWLSNALCMVSTGGSYTKRGNFTDNEETIINVCRPVVFTAVGSVIPRADLADRAIVVALAPISDESRVDEQELERKLDVAIPRVLGALLDGMVHGIRELPKLSELKLPRMADFIKWTRACEGAYWEPGEIQHAYQNNILDAVEAALEGDYVAIALHAWIEANRRNTDTMTGKPVLPWVGTSTELHAAILPYTSETARRERSMPKNGKALSDHLMLIAPSLRKQGVDVTRGRTRTGRWLRVAVAP